MNDILNEELSQIFENAAVALILVDKQGRIKRINKAGEDFIGQGKVEIYGKLAGEALRCVNTFINNHTDCGKSDKCVTCPLRNSFELTYNTGNNTYKYLINLEIKDRYSSYTLFLLISTALLYILNDKYVLITVEDITKEKNLQIELEQSKKELEELIATKNKFFSIISHDLKNPFSTISGFAKLLLEDYSNFTDEEREYFLNLIFQSSENTYKLLENLLLWSKIQVGKMKTDLEKVYISDIINETVFQLRTLADKKIIQINILSSSNITVNIDKYMISTVLRNLISNAIKFTPKYGFISIYTEKVNNMIQISIKDSGVGIDSQNISRLFDISDKFSTQGTEQEEGSGLGLILCKEFIDLHKGEIWVESEIGEGSTFRFTISIN